MVARRFPVGVRPALLLPGLALALFGLARGPAWLLDVQRFLGTYIVRLAAADSPSGLGVFALLGGAVGVLLLAASLVPGPPRRGLLARSMRFYPFVALLALFLVAYGAVFLLDASLRGADEAAGPALYLTLDYAGVPDRPVQSAGALVLALAGLGLLPLSFGLRAPAAAPKRKPRPAPPARRPAAATRARPARA